MPEGLAIDLSNPSVQRFIAEQNAYLQREGLWPPLEYVAPVVAGVLGSSGGPGAGLAASAATAGGISYLRDTINGVPQRNAIPRAAAEGVIELVPVPLPRGLSRMSPTLKKGVTGIGIEAVTDEQLDRLFGSR